MNEIGITQIDPVDGRIYKGMTHCGRPGFSLDVVYTLADGRKQRSTVSSERKKNVLAALERERRAAAAGCMTANFNDKGEFWGTTQKWTIGSAGLVPQKPEAKPFQVHAGGLSANLTAEEFARCIIAAEQEKENQ